MSKMLDAALEYASNGIPVFPLLPKQKKPRHSGGVNGATTDEKQIREWWGKFPNDNIGVPMGAKSGVIGIDVDYKDGCRTDFIAGLPPTIKTQSPSGGHHVFFRNPEGGIKNNLKLERGATVRSDGYYFAVPPSTTASGSYTAHGTLGIDEIAEVPEWIIERNKTAAVDKSKFQLPDKILKGEQHVTLFRQGCSLRAQGFGLEEIFAAFEVSNSRLEDKASQEALRALASDICSRYPAGIPDYSTEEVNSALGHAEPLIAAKATAAIVKVSEAPALPKSDGSYSTKLSQADIKRIGQEILDIRFKIHADSKRTILYNITNIDKKEVEICVNEDVLLRRLNSNLEEKLGRAVDVMTTKRVYDTWKITTSALKEVPKPFAWSDEDAWSFRRLPFKPEPGDYNAWKEFLLRLSDAGDFMAFVWSVFEIKNRSRQFLYLYDPIGETGKSTVIRVLGRIFGASYTAINNSMTSGAANRWLMGELYGKRLVTWGDCKNPKFCMSEIVRNITSGDSVSIEFKGQPVFAAEMYLKLIIGSNQPPELTGSGADTSRLINIIVEPNADESKKDDPLWESKLVAELPYFLDACREVYERKCPHHGKILLSDKTKDVVREHAEAFEERWEEICHRRIRFDKDATTTMTDWKRFLESEKLFDNRDAGNLKAYLQRRSKAFVRKRHGKDRSSVYHGIKILEERSTLISETIF